MFLVLMVLFNFVSHSETTINDETQMDARRLPTYTWRGAQQLDQKITRELAYLRSLQPRSGGLEYAYINKKTEGGAFATYLVELKTGNIIDTFPSLIGYNGFGCGKGKTRPGVTKLTNTDGKGASKKKHWGNNWKYYDIEPINGITQCPIDKDIVAHSNVNLKNKDVGDQISSHSAGCFTVPPDRLDQMDKYAGKAFIYNVPPTN